MKQLLITGAASLLFSFNVSAYVGPFPIPSPTPVPAGDVWSCGVKAISSDGTIFRSGGSSSQTLDESARQAKSYCFAETNENCTLEYTCSLSIIYVDEPISYDCLAESNDGTAWIASASTEAKSIELAMNKCLRRSTAPTSCQVKNACMVWR